MSFGEGFRVAAATKRTFYIERRGDQYELVKVWEVGHPFTPADMAFAFTRVMDTDPDERLIAEQSVSIDPAGPDGIVRVKASDAATAAATANATERILRGERPEWG